MRENYGKLFESMYSGSLYGAGMHVFAVWGWILAHKDENGIVEINPKRVSNELGGDEKDVQKALDYLCATDPDSRSKEEEGRRIVRISQFGYRVVNHEKYCELGQDRSDYWREYKASKRAKGGSGFVYYLGVPGGILIKIGYSVNPWARLEELRTANPKLELLALERGSKELERQRHLQFDEIRQAREWFQVTDELNKLICELRKNYESTTEQLRPLRPHM